MNVMMVLEACASIALTHRSDCPCVVCRAHHGDEDALMEILAYLDDAPPAV
jgi:hypothetical protein